MLRPFVRGLKLVNLPNLEATRLKRAKIKLSKAPKIYSRLSGGGGGGGGGGVEGWGEVAASLCPPP